MRQQNHLPISLKAWLTCRFKSLSFRSEAKLTYVTLVVEFGDMGQHGGRPVAVSA